jgi:P-type Cu+ transporter
MGVTPWLFTFRRRRCAGLLLVLTTPVLFWSGRHFFRGAYSGLLHGTADMNTLIALGTGSAYVFSVVATVAPGLFTRAGLGGRLLRGRGDDHRADPAGQGAGGAGEGSDVDAIRRLMGLQPKTARVIRDGAELDVPVEDLVVGDVIVVRPGERCRWMAWS